MYYWAKEEHQWECCCICNLYLVCELCEGRMRVYL